MPEINWQRSEGYSLLISAVFFSVLEITANWLTVSRYQMIEIKCLFESRHCICHLSMRNYPMSKIFYPAECESTLNLPNRHRLDWGCVSLGFCPLTCISFFSAQLPLIHYLQLLFTIITCRNYVEHINSSWRLVSVQFIWVFLE